MQLLSLAWLPILLLGSEVPDSCPADGTGSASCRSAELNSEVDVLPESTTPAQPELPRTRSLVEQEISHLRDLVELCKERVALLKDLRQTLTQGSLGLPEAHQQLLQDSLPTVWEVAGDAQTSEAAGAGDFIVAKATISQEDPVSLIRWLPLRSGRSAGPASASQIAMPGALLVAVQEDSSMRLFTPQGELALSFSAGHEARVVQLAVSPLHDEYLIATGDVSGHVRMHRISVRHRRTSRDKSGRKGPGGVRLSQHLGFQANVTMQFAGELVAPGPRAGAEFTALVLASNQGTKYFIIGDSEGGISILTRNGTLHTQLTAPGGARVESFSTHIGHIVFVAGGEWGFVDLERFEVRVMRCSKFEGRISSAVVDSQHSSRVLAADDRGAVWVFNVRDKRTCKIEHRFPEEATRAPVSLASIRGFIVALDSSSAARGRVSTVALNMTHAGKKLHEPERDVSPVVWRHWTSPVRDWTVHKRYQQGDLMATLSADGLEIEVVEILMHAYQAPQGDTLANFKLPVFAVAIVLVLGYQYVKQQGAFDPGLVEAAAS